MNTLNTVAAGASSRLRVPAAPSRERIVSRRNIIRLRHAVRRRGLLPAAALRDGRDVAEGHAGDPPGQHLRAADGNHLRALGQGVGDGLHRPQLRRPFSRGFWNSVRITVPSVILSIAIASVNGYALANWRFKGADIVLHDPDRRRLHSLSGDDLSDRHHPARDRHLRHADGPGHRAYDLRHADPDAAVPQLFLRRCRRNCSRRRASTAPASGASISASCCRCRCRSSSSR